MTTNSDRVFLKYDPDGDGGEVSLPGFLNAVPSIVSPGDVFSVPSRVVEDNLIALSGGRFDPVPAPSDASPHAGMTKATLGELVGVDPEKYGKDELVQLADDRARMFPPVPGAAPVVDAAAPVFGQDDPDPFDLDPSGDDAGDTPEG